MRRAQLATAWVALTALAAGSCAQAEGADAGPAWREASVSDAAAREAGPSSDSGALDAAPADLGLVPPPPDAGPPLDATSPPPPPPPPPADAGRLDPGLALPPAGGQPCSTPGSLTECTSTAEVCRFFTPAEGRCESCVSCGNLGAPCGASDECDILFACFLGRCTNFCHLGTFECGRVDACLDVGHPTIGVCLP